MTTPEPPSSQDPQEQPGSVPPSYPPQGSYPPPPPGGGGQGSGGWPPPPPPAGPGPTQPFSAADAIGYGWKKFAANPVPWLLGALAAIVVSAGFSGVNVSMDVGASDADSLALGFSLIDFIVNVAATIVSYLITAVLYRGALDEAEGRRFSFGDTFSRLPLGSVILTSLLIGIGVTIGLVLCVLPGIVFAFFSFFALLFVVDREESPVQAISSSFSLVGANLGNALLLALLCGLILVVGLCLCFVGLFVAVPVTTIATAYGYLRFQDRPVL